MKVEDFAAGSAGGCQMTGGGFPALYPRPFIYISDFFETHRTEYNDCLLAFSGMADFLRWIRDLLEDVVVQSKVASNASGKILAIQKRYRELLAEARNVPDNTHRILDDLFRTPFVSVSQLSNRWNTPHRSIQNAVNKLVEVGILTEITDRKRNKLYLARELHDLVLSI